MDPQSIRCFPPFRLDLRNEQLWRGKRLLHIEPRLAGGGKYELRTLELHADTPLTLAVARHLVQQAHALNLALGDPAQRAA